MEPLAPIGHPETRPKMTSFRSVFFEKSEHIESPHPSVFFNEKGLRWIGKKPLSRSFCYRLNEHHFLLMTEHDWVYEQPVFWCRLIEEMIQVAWNHWRRHHTQSEFSWEAMIHVASRHILGLISRYPDVVFGYIFTDRWEQGRYASRQMLIHALLLGFIAVEHEQRYQKTFFDYTAIQWIQAALLANIDYAHLVERMMKHDGELSKKDKTTISHHPIQESEQLRRSGFNWLCESIEQHHECTDGSGYPYGLLSDSIQDEARILFINERFASLIRYRGQRDGLHWSDAKKTLRSEMDAISLDDGRMAEIFIDLLPHYPAGLLVETNTHEWCAVIKNEDHVHDVLMRAIVNFNGSLYPLNDMTQYRHARKFLNRIVRERIWEDVDVLRSESSIFFALFASQI